MPSSRTRATTRALQGTPRSQLLAPMSERQQLALVMQLSSLDAAPEPEPVEEKKPLIFQRNERGETPLHVAAIRGDHELVKKHLENGQDPNVPDFAGWTPLHEACSYGWYQVVEVLVNRGANVNVKGRNNDTPLHDATASGNLPMVKFLVQHGAEVFAKNSMGKMPIEIAAPHIYDYLKQFKPGNTRGSHGGRTRDDGNKKGGNASKHSESTKRKNMETITQNNIDSKNAISQNKGSVESKNEIVELCSSLVSSNEEDSANIKKYLSDDNFEIDTIEDEGSKRKKKKDNEEKEPMGKPPPPAPRGHGRSVTGSKQPGPASKTGGVSGKGSGAHNSKGGSNSSSGKSNSQSHGRGSGKGSNNSHQSKSSGGSKGSHSKQEKKGSTISPKTHRDHNDADTDDHKFHESSGPKVPPLKIVIPGGGSGNRNEQDDVRSGQRGSGKGRGSASTLPYVMPCTSSDMGQTSDSSDGNYDEKRTFEGNKTGHRVLRSHRTHDGDKERISPQRPYHSNRLSASSSSHDDHAASSSSRSDPDLHPRKRKLKSSKDSHSRDSKHDTSHESSTLFHNVTHCNPYQMYIHIRKQISRRQKSLFPVKPKPPKDFNKYLMNRCNYTLQSNVNHEPRIDIPHTLPPQMLNDFLEQEKERRRLRIQHLVEKEKLVLAVEQEILRVHGRAERAVANQALPYSACTILRDREVYNLLAPEQEEKRNAQRSRCNGRQINSWLQEVDDKWEKIKEGMLRRQHTEAQALYAVQLMSWEWRLKEMGVIEYKAQPKVDPTHVPQIHVSNFDLPA